MVKSILELLGVNPTTEELERLKKIFGYVAPYKPVIFPDHFFPPDNVDTLDIFNWAPFNSPASDITLLEYRCPDNARVKILKYALYSTAPSPADVQFRILINGNRVMPEHGQRLVGSSFNELRQMPNGNLTELITTNVDLKPRDFLRVSIDKVVPGTHDIGVRFVGYVDYGNFRDSKVLG